MAGSSSVVVHPAAWHLARMLEASGSPGGNHRAACQGLQSACGHDVAKRVSDLDPTVAPLYSQAIDQAKEVLAPNALKGHAINFALRR